MRMAEASISERAERFKTEAVRVGAIVYQAGDARDAADYVLKIAREHGVKRVVRSSSIAAEEIGLNKHLEDAGIEVVETGIERWIARRGREGASPGDLEQAAELLSKAADPLANRLESDSRVLLQAARRYLRQSILNADMGISGANIAVAETGTLVIMDCEGDARLVSTFPPLHMALVGGEKLVLTLGDATSIVRLLGKSGAGQKMPGYITSITGRSTTADIPGAPLLPAQGPAEVHIVLLDRHKPAGELALETYRLP